MKSPSKVLVIANSARSIACSARKAGYTVFAIDRFGDVDMRKCAHKSILPLTGDGTKIQELAAGFGDVDAVILGPGFEHPDFKNIFNNLPDVMEKANDKSLLPRKLESLGIPHPETKPTGKAHGLGFPLVIKPKSGSGGMRNMIVRNEEELAVFNDRNDSCEFIAQEFVEGTPCSASVISTGDDAVVVALNEQLIGVPWLTRLPFAYCGNITPFHSKSGSEMIDYAQRLALEFGLVGSNGIDFILSGKNVHVIEVNPRFQGSLDTVELSTGINVFDAHIKSFAGELPQVREHVCFAAKTILYADKNVTVTEKLSEALIKYMDAGQAADVPHAGLVIKPDEPVTTMLSTAKTRGLALEKVRNSSFRIKGIT